MSASLHAPIPVSRSGVRLEPFTVKNGSLKVWKPPDSRSSRLGPPPGGGRRGVWQLLQAPMVLTRYPPRSTGDCATAEALPAASAASVTITSRNMSPHNRAGKTPL